MILVRRMSVRSLCMAGPKMNMQKWSFFDDFLHSIHSNDDRDFISKSMILVVERELKWLPFDAQLSLCIFKWERTARYTERLSKQKENFPKNRNIPT